MTSCHWDKSLIIHDNLQGYIKKILTLGLLILLLCTAASPHYKARYHVSIYTDGDMDDLRAICMLLASEQTEVIAITCIDGVPAIYQACPKYTPSFTRVSLSTWNGRVRLPYFFRAQRAAAVPVACPCPIQLTVLRVDMCAL